MKSTIKNRLLVGMLLTITTLSQVFAEQDNVKQDEVVKRQDCIQSIERLSKAIAIKKGLLATGGGLIMIASLSAGSSILQNHMMQGVPLDDQASIKLGGACFAGLFGLLETIGAVLPASSKYQMTQQISLQELRDLEWKLLGENRDIYREMVLQAGMAIQATSAGYILHTLADKNLGLASIPGIIGGMTVGAVGFLCSASAVLGQ